jgi:hypothetical protein
MAEFVVERGVENNELSERSRDMMEGGVGRRGKWVGEEKLPGEGEIERGPDEPARL